MSGSSATVYAVSFSTPRALKVTDTGFKWGPRCRRTPPLAAATGGGRLLHPHKRCGVSTWLSYGPPLDAPPSLSRALRGVTHYWGTSGCGSDRHARLLTCSLAVGGRGVHVVESDALRKHRCRPLVRPQQRPSRARRRRGDQRRRERHKAQGNGHLNDVSVAHGLCRGWCASGEGPKRAGARRAPRETRGSGAVYFSATSAAASESERSSRCAELLSKSAKKCAGNAKTSSRGDWLARGLQSVVANRTLLISLLCIQDCWEMLWAYTRRLSSLRRFF
eukprot:scaffold427_cov263-Pinguiococcus_pyrenoidosus.AAC.24